MRHIAEIRGPGGKINPPRMGRMGPHFGEHEAVPRPQGGHGETVAHARIRKTEIDPRGHGGIAGLEPLRAHHGDALLLDDLPGVLQQHAAVEHARPLRQPLAPMLRDGLRLIARESPIVGRHGTVEGRDAPYHRIAAHASMVPWETVTTAPPTEAPASAPPSICMRRWMMLGRPISNPCSITSR